MSMPFSSTVLLATSFAAACLGGPAFLLGWWTSGPTAPPPATAVACECHCDPVEKVKERVVYFLVPSWAALCWWLLFVVSVAVNFLLG